VGVPEKRRLVGAAEIGDMFGVSRQRVTQLMARADFPSPLQELRMGKVWDFDAVVAWAKRTGRTVHSLPDSKH
jgi:hypothetical protein